MRFLSNCNSGLRCAVAAVAARFLDERDRWLVWAPVLIGAGIAGYFALRAEPPWWSGPCVAFSALFFLWTGGPRLRIGLACLCLLLLSLGFTAAQLRTHLVAAPVLERPVTTTVSGRVRQVDAFARGPRILLDEISFPRRSDIDPPAQVRIRVRQGGIPAVGTRISVHARLLPPGAPASPGAYDFQRHAWYARIGAVGYAFGVPRVLPPARGDIERSPALWIADARLRIAERVRTAIPGTEGAVAAALITGDRSAIPQATLEAMRASGLAHLLAISGLHMGLVAATIFFGLRALFALSERLALRFPIKKWAAGAALIGAFAYLLLTGATVPTQRAFLMAGMVLVAVLLDRTAISLRLVAWAATVILLLTPESLLSASFQMSFAAVIALVAIYENGNGRINQWGGAGPGRKVMLYLGGVGLTTLVAGTATGVFALYHFGRIAHYGLAANLLAVPVTAFWIMPWAVIAMALMPFGLEALALVPMSWGISLVVTIAETVSGWPGAVGLTPAMPVWGLVAAALGGLWLCLWRRRWLYVGLVGIAAGLMSIGLRAPPDILVSPDGRLMGVRDDTGQLVLSSTTRDKRTARTWLEKEGQRQARAWTSEVRGMRCDGLGCIYRTKGQIVALISDPRALADDCRLADIVISAVPVRRACPSAQLLVDRFSLWRYGGHAIWLDRLRVLSVAQRRGERPWTNGPAQRSSSGGAIRSAALVP